MLFKAATSKRILKGFGANSFSQLSSVAIQLASLPIFLSFWSMDQYGLWIMISAVPAYISLSDVGIITVGKNKAVMAYFSGEIEQSNKIFQSSLLFLNIASLAVLAAVMLLLYAATIKGKMEFSTAAAIFFLVVAALMSLYTNLAEALYRIVDQYPRGLWLTSIARLTEWGGSILFGVIFGSLIGVAFGALIGRTLTTIYTLLDARHRCPQVRIGTKHSELKEIGLLLRPSIIFMAFPVGNAISIQGVTLLVGGAFGPATLAVFNTYRTLSRVLVQATSMLSHSLWPEFTRAYGQGEHSALKNIYKKGLIINLLFITGISISILLLGEHIINFWSRGKIPFEATMYDLFILSAFIGSAWHIPRIFVIATNKHERLAISYAAATVILLISMKAILTLKLSINAVVIALCMFELMMAIFAFRSSRALTATLKEINE